MLGLMFAMWRRDAAMEKWRRYGGDEPKFGYHEESRRAKARAARWSTIVRVKCAKSGTTVR